MIADVSRLGSQTPLVARRNEMRTLQSAAARARSGRPAVALLSGDAGVGKSRLLSELLSSAGETGDVVVIGRCLETAEAALPYLPFVEAVSQLAELEPNFIDDAGALRALLPQRRQGAAEVRDLGQLELFDALRAALDRFAADRTVVLALEDLHWSDRSSRDLFSFLASRLSTQRLLMVATYRSDDLHRRHPLRPLLAELVRLPTVERLHLDAFDRADARSFVRRLAADSLDETAVGEIAARSEGNAFMAEELVLASSSGAPQDLADVLLSRMERLPTGAQQLMRLAAAIGRRFSHDRLCASATASAAELDDALREAVTHSIVVPDEAGQSYAFRHALLHEAVYSDLLPGERSRLHRQVAQTLADDRHPGAAAQLARHSMESHDFDVALTASVRAAQEAEELAAPAEALAHLERALQLWPQATDPEPDCKADELDLTVRAAKAAGASGEPDRAAAWSRSAIALADRCGDPMRAATVRRRYAEYLLTLDGYEQRAYDAALEAWTLISDSDPSAEKAWAQGTLSRTALALRPPEEAQQLAAQAAATARAVPGEGPQTAACADALVTEAVALGKRRPDPKEVLDRLFEAATLARRVDAHEVELRALFHRAMTLFVAGELAEVLTELDSAAAHAARNGLTWSPYGLETAVLQVVCRFLAGDWDGATAAAEPAGEEVSRTVTTRLSAAELLVAVGRGCFDLADRRLAYLRRHWRIDQQVMSQVGLCGAELEAWRGRARESADYAEEAMARLPQIAPWHPVGISLCTVGVSAYADLAADARRDGDDAAAQQAATAGEALASLAHETVSRLAATSRTLGPEGQAWRQRMQAEVARLHGEDDPALWRAVSQAFEYGEVYRKAHADWRCAAALLAGGDADDRAEAARRLQAAAAVADDLRAEPLRAAVSSVIERARLGGTSDAANHSSTLFTPREAAVLRLVSEGLTNRQIGAQLYISEKTVSVHLSRAMAKLGVGSRAEAVSAAYTQGYLTPATANES